MIFGAVQISMKITVRSIAMKVTKKLVKKDRHDSRFSKSDLRNKSKQGMSSVLFAVATFAVKP